MAHIQGPGGHSARRPPTLLLDSAGYDEADRDVAREGRGPQPTAYLTSGCVRVVFTAYLLLIAVGLAFYIVIGITNHQ